MDERKLDVVEAGRTEALSMRGAIAGRAPDAEVRLTVAHFAHLADLLDALASKAASRWDDTMDDPRYFVPLDHFRRVKQEAARVEGEYAELQQRYALDELLKF